MNPEEPEMFSRDENVWVHDARLRPGIRLDYQSDLGKYKSEVSLTIDEPSDQLVQDLVERFWRHIDPPEEEEL